eukprot:9823040-Alexandrium_andersonii.AAC.1
MDRATAVRSSRKFRVRRTGDHCWRSRRTTGVSRTVTAAGANGSPWRRACLLYTSPSPRD